MNLKLKVLENPPHPNFDCSKCHSECKALCCSVCPIPLDIWIRNEKKVVRKVKKLMPSGLEAVIPLTKDGYCPFLKKDYKCAIYDDRPDVCKLYGSECHPYMTCHFQDKEGNIRTKEERNELESKLGSFMKNVTF